MPLSADNRPRIHFVANCVYSDHLAGGDIHFLHMAEAAIASGYSLHFFGGSALARHLQKRGLPVEICLTDKKSAGLSRIETIGEQLRLLANYAGRFFRTLQALGSIKRDDLAYSVTDYWV